MSRKELEVRICDQCDTEVNHDLKPSSFGIHNPFLNWVVLSYTLKGCANRTQRKDFCCFECLSKWIDKHVEEKHYEQQG